MKGDRSSSHATGEIASRIAALSPAKRALLDVKLKQQTGASARQHIPRRTEESTAPLSFAQQRLWFLDQLEKDSPVYNLSRAWRLSGGLDVEALRQTIDTLVVRHEMLRSTFEAVGGQPTRAITPASSIPLPIVDLRELPSSQRETESAAIALTETKLPFDLARGPLFRVELLRLAPEDHVLVLTLHHIVADRWSMGVLQRELGILYGAFSNEQPSPLSELPIQYADFARWQRQWLEGDELETQLSYWKEQLRDLTVLELPTDRPRPAVQSYHGAHEPVSIPGKLTEKLDQLSRREGTTLFMTLLAGFIVLLARYTRQRDIVVGSVIANRRHLELEPLVGMVANTLVLRTDLRGNPSFRSLLGRVRTMSLAAFAHQDLPFEKLVEELQPERDLSRNPLFQVAFIWQNTPNRELALAGMRITPFSLHNETPIATGNQTAKFDLTLSMMEGDDGIEGMLEYSTDLFYHTTIQRMGNHLRTLLKGIIADPDQPISDLPVITETERRQLLVEWNDTKVDFPKDLCLHELFEAQVERTPDAVALVYEGGRLTYRELNQRANQLAHYLQGLGVGPDVLVGVCLERSLEMIIGLLGILKAGGAYVPLDPEYPTERLAFMLKDSRTPVLVTEERRAGTLGGHGTRVVCVDTNWGAISQESEQTPVSRAAADNLAYVIYTSGSTGRPKGIVTGHRAICNQMLWIQANWPLTVGDRVLQKSTFSFDVSLWELFWPLQVGASLIMARPGGHRDNTYLREIVIAEGITMIHFVPSMLSIFLLEPGVEACHSLRQVLCGGEALSFELQQRFFGCLQADLLHFYGPTEASITVTGWTCERGGRLGMVPLGAPVANTQIYLLDRYLELAPVGVPGELHIGGDSLARGYLNHPELTAEKFTANPLSVVTAKLEETEPGGRLYETGDLARYRSDGNLEFLGRIDHQVKIRGFRVELAEIEAVLCEHPAVRETVVLQRKDMSGERLVAYAIPNHGATPSIGELRGFLKEKLPNYMVPSSVVLMEALPLTPNGKVDRDALPEPDWTADPGGTFVAPRTHVEATVAAIWQQALNLERVSVHDNLFELGGHSLLAMQVLSRLRQRFEIELPLVKLFELPTVAAQAETIETIRWAVSNLQATPGSSPKGLEETKI